MLWYAVQTYTGREEKLAEMIRRMIPDGCAGECFVPYFEQLHCWHGQNQIRVLRLFPGYLFLSTEDIDGCFRSLKRLPVMSKVLSAAEFEFIPMHEGEAEFFLGMMDPDHILRLTYVATDGRNHISYLSGPLENCGEHILEYQFRRRYARIRLQIAGKEKEARAGIILNDDVRRETAYGKVEAPVRVPEKYEIPVSKSAAADPCLAPGDRVTVIDGAFEGNVAVVRKIKSSVVQVTVQMFGRDISAEMPAVSVRKLE